jgi:hypothetical protein
MLPAMSVKTLEIPEPVKRRLLHLRILSGTETEPVLDGSEVKNLMRLLDMPLGDIVWAVLANGDNRTLRLDPRLPMIPSYTKEAHEAGMPRGLVCIGKVPGHYYFGMPPSGASVLLYPMDDEDQRQLPLTDWLDEQIAHMTEVLHESDDDEKKGRVFQSIHDDDLEKFEPGVEMDGGSDRSVTHKKFGKGEILRELEGGEKLEIRFDDGAVKTLLARFVERPGQD